VLSEGELAIKRESQGKLDSDCGGTIDGDCKLMARFPIIQVE